MQGNKWLAERIYNVGQGHAIEGGMLMGIRVVDLI